MIKIGNFFFRYRNLLFIVLYLALFIPSPAIFSPEVFGEQYYLWPIIIGLLVTVSGQLIRGVTIGLAYIIRGGKQGKVYAEDLVTQGIFNHCRNPLYVGNILMLVGVGILSNSLIYLLVFIPFFLFVYQAIVLAEENFLRGKFGQQFEAYCQRVNRWVPNLRGIGATFQGMHFRWRRWILKEYNTQYVWLSGITLILLLKYDELTGYDTSLRNTLLVVILSLLLLMYLFVRYLKKSGKMKE
ncbi:isoprenylcysteine carboxylmethyltransferase family protein [Chitinophagaceae bacterium LB-8]|uniref:Isoprenylcysteine carboxylmethyltransferase family protein n=1 Tax=Paraflavisolibacter caeni TaxID=2982496 RepID=A0A9X3BIW9_9BACT|nr:isoprenylcysteine carboxylmethyltransferase family protein [Paraflavisolibacter caeni]MCU7552052.1 isoprenylcysteine carboxylmethyltransferase family protein [Paraflavisolibacter caeni]